MNDTYPLGAQPSYITPASAYSLALASADVKKGQISTIRILQSGASYSSPPAVTISGGASGAAANAVVNSGRGTQIKIDKAGSSYIAPPAITFTNGGSSKTATAIAIVQNSQVAAIDVTSAGMRVAAVAVDRAERPFKGRVLPVACDRANGWNR